MKQIICPTGGCKNCKYAIRETLHPFIYLKEGITVVKCRAQGMKTVDYE